MYSAENGRAINLAANSLTRERERKTKLMVEFPRGQLTASGEMKMRAFFSRVICALGASAIYILTRRRGEARAECRGFQLNKLFMIAV